MKKHLHFEALEDRRLLTATAYRDLTTFQDPLGTTAPLFSQAGSYFYNAPALVTTNSGTVLAFAEQRIGSQDTMGVAIVMRRSTDGGNTFAAKASVATADRAAGFYINGVCPIVDQDTGSIFLLYTINTSSVFVVRSNDDGLTWSAPTDITGSVKVTVGNNPGPTGEYPDTPWGWYAVGPAHGIQLHHGAHAGRLMAGADHRLDNNYVPQDDQGISFSHVIYSDDHGQSWHLGGGMDQSYLSNRNTNECTLAELDNDDVYMNIRLQSDAVPYRAFSVSHDGGITWENANWDFQLPAKPVSGSLLRLNTNTLLLSTLNNSVGDLRHEMTIYLSYNEGADWVRGRTIDFGYAGYSDMTLIGQDTILLLYTRGRNGGKLFGASSSTNPALTFEELELAKVNLTWLQSTAPYYFDWQLNEKLPGFNVPISDPLPIAQDSGPWDQKALIYSTSPVQYVASPTNSAVRLTEGDDELVLSQGDQAALQFDLNDPFTIDVKCRTTDSDGILIGSRPTVKNWTVAVVNGHAQFSMFDGEHTSLITSEAAVNDGNWHEVVAIHDPSAQKLRLYVDGVPAALSVTDESTSPRNSNDPLDPIVVGAYNDSSNQLAVDVDDVRITRAVVTPLPLGPPVPPGPSSATVMLFYGNSAFDATGHDDAIASDKTPYVPGTGITNFSAVSSYSRGINGLMVDLSGTSLQRGFITGNDFIFKVGNNNSPSLWGAAPSPQQVNVRLRAGTGGADRVELLWPDNAIKNTWLEIIVKGNDVLGGFDVNTGLDKSAIFVLGSAPGDSGTGDTASFIVNSADEIVARNDPHGLGNRATMTNTQDYNRDGFVNATDQVIARNSVTNIGNALKFLNLDGSGPFAPVGDYGISSALAMAVDSIHEADSFSWLPKRTK
jgi:sialidase-1